MASIGDSGGRNVVSEQAMKQPTPTAEDDMALEEARERLRNYADGATHHYREAERYDRMARAEAQKILALQEVADHQRVDAEDLLSPNAFVMESDGPVRSRG